jgi:hypothetical protein
MVARSFLPFALLYGFLGAHRNLPVLAPFSSMARRPKTTPREYTPPTKKATPKTAEYDVTSWSYNT